jgi:hypothetical protein
MPHQRPGMSSREATLSVSTDFIVGHIFVIDRI